MRKRLLCVILGIFCLWGCAPSSKMQSVNAALPVGETTSQTAQKVITVYPGATEYYLGEILDYSWEQTAKPEFVMIHFCSAVVNHPDNPYNHEDVRQTFIDAGVSIHYIIDREGEIFCYIPEDRSAWHAGRGTWNNDEAYTNKMNVYSIGIELMGIGTQEEMSIYMTKANYNKLKREWIGFTDAQYDSLKDLVADICQRNDIPLDRNHVIGHDQYNPKKNDPGDLFDWSRILP